MRKKAKSKLSYLKTKDTLVSLPGKPISYKALKDFIHLAEKTSVVSLNDAKNIWHTKHLG